MRPEKLYLSDIVLASEAIHRFCDGVAEEDFYHDELRQSAVLQKLIIIGEAAARLPDSFLLLHSDIEWLDIIGFRNIAVHEYFSVNWPIVWTTAIQDVPDLQMKIQKILEMEFQ
jgi:uncharacterized protein with HEPN domain